jgi:glycosyltransferase involved in cell wall biosynthesis
LAGRLGLEDAVEWLGFSRDVARELGRLDLFVLPSIRAEGLPMAVLEAMAAGVPVIASRVDGATDALGRADVADACGLLVPPADPQNLAAGIVRVMSGAIDWRQLRQRAFRRQRTLFSDRAMAKGVARVYREVLRGCGRS